MANFDESSLKNLEQLCHIELTHGEEKKLMQSLQQALDYVQQLNEVQTEGVAPCTYVLREWQSASERKDAIGPTTPREEFLANAPDHIGGMIRIPPVINK